MEGCVFCRTSGEECVFCRAKQDAQMAARATGMPLPYGDKFNPSGYSDFNSYNLGLASSRSNPNALRAAGGYDGRDGRGSYDSGRARAGGAASYNPRALSYGAPGKSSGGGGYSGKSGGSGGGKI